MSQVFKISHRHSCNFSSLLSDKLFFNVALVSHNSAGEETTVKAHRLILAKYSKWFEREFAKSTEPQTTLLRLELPINPDNKMDEFIQMLYSQEFKMRMSYNQEYAIINDNTIPMLKIASFYEFKQCETILLNTLDDFCKTHSKDWKFLTPILCKLAEYELVGPAKMIIPYITEDFLKIIKNEHVVHYINMESLLERVRNGSVYAYLLRQPNILKATTGEERIKLIETFYAHFPDISEQERQDLAHNEIYNWESKDAYLTLAKYKCEWLPPSISRRIYQAVFSARRATAKNFEKDIKTADQKVNRWYPFSWLSYIADAKQTEKTPEVNIIKFISTFGYFTEAQYNPAFYFLLTGKPFDSKTMMKRYAHDNVFLDNDESYVPPLYLKGNNEIEVRCDFGQNAFIQPSKIILSMNINRVSEQCEPKKLGNSSQKMKYFRYPTSVQVVTELNNKVVMDRKFDNSSHIVSFDVTKPITAFAIKRVGDSTFKVRNVEITGSFLNHAPK